MLPYIKIIIIAVLLLLFAGCPCFRQKRQKTIKRFLLGILTIAFVIWLAIILMK